MSRERLNHEPLNPELSKLESALGSLRAGGAIDRDELLFEAGRRSVPRTSGNLLWKTVSGVLGVLLIAQAVVVWREPSLTVAEQSSETVESKSLDFPEAVPSELQSVEDSGASPEQPIYLQMRKTALADGLDAAYSPTDRELMDSPTRETNQRKLLEDLLGS